MRILKAFLPLLIVLALLAGCGESPAPAETTQTPDITPTEAVNPTIPDLSAPVEYSGEVDPAAVALVANGDEVIVAMSVAEMVEAISPEGTSRIRLLQDISRDKAISLPYSCVLDFDGHTLATNPEKGTGMMIVEAGTLNPVTTVKNGKMVTNGVSLWVNSGAIVAENMQIRSLESNCIGLYDPNGDYKAINQITGCTLISGGNGCVCFNKSDIDYTATGITIENTRLINTDPEGGPLLDSRAENRTAGTFHLGDGVDFYGYGYWAVPENYLYFTGKMAHKTQITDLTVDDLTLTGIQCWSTENDQAPENMLFIGNSFCYYFVQELQGIAAVNGHHVNVANLYEAGCRVDEHWKWLNDPQDKYELWITNDFGRFMVGGIKNLQEALPLMNWDKITLQQHFTPARATTYEVAMESCTPYTKNLFDYLKTSNPDAQLYWHEHWSFQVGHDTVPDIDTQNYQYENLRAASITISEENGVTMIPGGDAWQLARADALFGDTLCKSDNIHDGNTEGGQYLNACVWYETLFQESCLGNSWRPDYRLSEEKINALQNYAHQAVTAYHGNDYLK